MHCLPGYLYDGEAGLLWASGRHSKYMTICFANYRDGRRIGR